LENIIEIPVNVSLVDDTTKQFTSTRNEADITRIFIEVNQIWTQAGIRFVPRSIQRETIQNNTILSLFNVNGQEQASTDNFITTYFVNSIPDPAGRQINGLAPTNLRRTFVADITTVPDFRATAHEFGHVLELEHVFGPNGQPLDGRLMAEGLDGELLTRPEIEIARNFASLFQN